MKKRPFFLASIGLSLITLANSGIATAGDFDPRDYKSYTGSACSPQNGAESASFRVSGSSLVNVSRAYRRVVCPLVRDLEGPTVPTTWLDVGPTVRSNANRQAVSCSVRSYDAFGNQVPTSLDSQGQSSEPTPTPIYLRLYPTEIAFDGVFDIVCNVPPGGSVVRYGAGEAGDTDSAFF